ncbi:MAG: serine protease, partial [Nanoarchaeota archaeon]
MSKKRSLKPLAAALAVVLGVFGGYWTAGALDVNNFQPTPISAPVKPARRQTLEDILNSSQKIVMNATYEINSFNSFGMPSKKEISLYGSGSSICVYKNLAENNLFFLTCDHVTSAPEEQYVIGEFSFKKIDNNMYETKINNNQFYVLMNDVQDVQQLSWTILTAKLKNVSMGIYQGVVKDSEGKVTDFKTIPLTELADTGFRDDDEEWVKNNDISLLKVDTGKMKEWEIDSLLNKFSSWDGKWANYYTMKQGDLLKVVGYPLGFERQICSGELTSKEGMEKSLNDNFYFTSAHLNPGNSGGPLVNINKEVI